MKRKVHTESEMVNAVQELKSCMEVSQVRRLKELEEENRKLKQMYAELALFCPIFFGAGRMGRM